MKRVSLFLLIGLAVFVLAACAKGPVTADSASDSVMAESVAKEPRTKETVIEEMVIYYGRDGEQAESEISELLTELHSFDADAEAKWKRIMELWKSVEKDLTVNEDVLPDGLPDTDELCLVVLGFQLNPDGSMKNELKERLDVTLAAAEKYPNSLVVCTGGGTATKNKSATEAGKMAEYLAEHGLAEDRIIVEDRSMTTAQNAMLTCEILKKQYPQVKKLAIISSDYHIATGVLLFGAQSELLAEEPGEEPFEIVSNAAYPAPSGTLSRMFQAGALIELSGDMDKAYEIYRGTYDIHELPPLNK